MDEWEAQDKAAAQKRRLRQQREWRRFHLSRARYWRRYGKERAEYHEREAAKHG